MDKNELIQFLKDNLTIEIKYNPPHYGAGNSVEVELKINGETINSSICWLD